MKAQVFRNRLDPAHFRAFLIHLNLRFKTLIKRFTNLEEFGLSEAEAGDSGVLAEFSHLLEVGDQLHRKIAFPLSADLPQEVSIPSQVLVREVVLHLNATF